MSEQKFYPTRGKIAVKKDEAETTTSAGLIYTEKQNNKFITGVIVSIGQPEILSSGKELQLEYQEGQRVLISVDGGYDSFGDIMILPQQSVVAILDMDIKIS